MDSELERARRDAHLNQDNPIEKYKLTAKQSRHAQLINARLLCLTGPCQGRVLELPHLGQAIIGRDPVADFSVFAPDISRRQFQIQWTEKGFWLNDLGSSSGTYLNKKRTVLTLLKFGDEICAGSHRFRFEPSDVSPPSDSTIPPKPSSDPFYRWRVHNDYRVFELETAFYGQHDVQDIVRGYTVMKEYGLHQIWRRDCQARRDAVIAKSETTTLTASDLNYCQACVLSLSRSIFRCLDCRPFYDFIENGPVIRAARQRLERDSMNEEERRSLSDIIADLAGLFFLERCLTNPNYYSVEQLSESLKAELSTI